MTKRMTKHKMLGFVLAAAALVGAGVAIGQDTSREIAEGREWLKLMNHPGDTDDTISRKEWNTYMDRQFQLADANHDGKLTVQELGHLHAMIFGK